VAAIGILGGTFDPVHCGHLRLALEMLERLELASVRLLPAPHPRLRSPPELDAGRRLEMLELAIGDVPGLEVDARELGRKGPTYTVDTLESLRAELGDTTICLIVGMDAFRRLDSWHRWPVLAELAHIVVARRPGWEPPDTGPVAELLERRACKKVVDLHAAPAGRVMLCDTPWLDISATRVRALIAEGRNIRFLVPDNVIEHLKRTRYYAHGE
jgi:nicotinate-nucleotide adenylyltransferase